MSRKFVCIHGHFYQPPRENPWLESVEAEESAAPYNDWNSRVNAECYAANGVARVLGDGGRISEVANNYESISFDFGPTLLAWMETADPETYEAVVAADRRSVAARSGHGNALAHAYNHMILPLASPRDRETQIVWGIADFKRRFGRDPEGMWLPETGVDLATLEALAEHRITFTVLAPHQASAVRELGTSKWTELAPGTIDPTRPYLCALPSGGSIVLFFYDGPISIAIAFERLLNDGNAYAQRLVSAFSPKRTWDQLVHVATDGESYGHHHPHGDMALAFALRALATTPDVTLTNYGEFLETHPPTHEVRIAEETSWSCVHGLGRWSDDCGCRIGGGTQAWRRVLRESLDWLRDELDVLFEEKASQLLASPWQARSEYVEVIADRATAAIDSFLGTHARRELDHFERTDALCLLEMQRHRMLMFTSCGWFFDDIAGLESVQVLKYAARAIQLATQFGGRGLEARFEAMLAQAPSNDPKRGDGAHVYRELVRPSIVDLRRVVAHYAITSLFDPPAAERRVYCYHLRNLDWCRERTASTQLAVGRVRVQSLVTLATEDVSFAVLHFGGHDFNCSLRGTVNVEAYEEMRDELLRVFETMSLTDVIHAFDRHFEGRYFTLPDLFLKGRRAVLATVTREVLEELEQAYVESYDRHRKLFGFLSRASYPLPDAFARTIEFALQRRVIAALHVIGETDEATDSALTALEEIAGEADTYHAQLSQDALGAAASGAAQRLADRLVDGWGEPATAGMRRLLELIARLGVRPSLWRAQNAIIAAMADHSGDAAKPGHGLDDLLVLMGIDPAVIERRP